MSSRSPPPAASIEMGEGEPWDLLPRPGFPLLSRAGTPGLQCLPGCALSMSCTSWANALTALPPSPPSRGAMRGSPRRLMPSLTALRAKTH